MNTKERITEYRNRIFSLRGRVSKHNDKRILSLAKNIYPRAKNHNQFWYFEDIIRRSIGNSCTPPKDLSLQGLNEQKTFWCYERIWELLNPFILEESEWKKFENDFIVKIIEEDEAAIPDMLWGKFFERLSKKSIEQWLRLATNHERVLDLNNTSLQSINMLSDRAFERFEKEFIYPSLIEEENRYLDEELKEKNLFFRDREVKYSGGNEHISPQLFYKGLNEEDIKRNIRIMNDLIPELSEIEKLRLKVIEYLKKENAGLKYSVRTLHKLPRSLQQKGRDYLYILLGENPFAKGKIDEVFKKPKKSKKKHEGEFQIIE